ncbi:tetratricopeptide repeat protein [Candidatus Poribacteria bacterium]|nr:tetratricopeptide repeat protein [Candidatus Poribacteria bacterium]
MRTLIYIMTPVLILTFVIATRYVTWDKLKGVDEESKAYKHFTDAAHFLQEEERHKALQALSLAIQDDPNYAEAYIQRGLIKFQLQQYNEAIADYTQTISLKRYYADAFAGRGDVYYALKNLPKALDDYSASLKSRRSAQIFTKRAKCYIDSGRIDEAIDDYTYIIKRRPTAIAYYNRGKAYYKKYLSVNDEQIAQLAIRDFDKSIEMQPLFALSFYHRGDVYRNLGQFELKTENYIQTIDLLTDALTNWKSETYLQIPVLLWRAVVYNKHNQTEEAKNDIVKIYELYTEYYLKKAVISDIL